MRKSSLQLAELRYKDAKRELQRQKEVNQRQLDVNLAEVNFQNAKTEAERNQKLFDQGVISKQELERFKLNESVTKTELDNAKLISQNSLSSFENTVDIRKQEYDAALNNLQLLREGATRNSSQVANIVTSTVSGMILDIPAEEGFFCLSKEIIFNEGTTIAMVADMSNLIFEGKIDESDVGKLKEGMEMELKIGALQDNKITALLEYIAPKGILEEGTVKFEVKAAVKPMEDVFLRAGYSANADIVINKREQVLSLEEKDIIYANDSAFIQIKEGDGMEKKYVQTGISDGINTEIVTKLDTSVQVRLQKQ